MNLRRWIKRLVHAPTIRSLNDDDRATRSLELLAPLFAGRSVALVGNAQSLFGQRQGQHIDSQEVVVRLNRGFVREEASQGKRTDVLGLAADLTNREIEREFGAPQLIWLSPLRELMSSDVMRREGEIAVFPNTRWHELSRLLGGARPSAGMILSYLLQTEFAPSSVKLFGFDWKQSKTFYHDEDRHVREGLRANWHDWQREQQLILQWANEGERLVICTP